MLQRMSDQHKISFLEEDALSDAKKIPDTQPKKTMAQLAEEQKAKKLDNKDNGVMTSKYISSARTGVVRDIGGPSKYIKSETSNSIFDVDKNARASKEIDSKTKTIQEKETIASNKREAERRRMDSLAEAIKGTEQRKASSVSPAGTQSGTNYKMVANGMSIFDTNDFQRLAEKTAGEQMTDGVKKRSSQTDDSWRGSGKSTTSRELKNRFFDSLLQKKED